MAIKIYEKFAPRANPADGDYPYGSIKNESVPGAKDGTPLDAVWANDYAGTDAELFAQAGIVPNGQPDKLGASQRVDAINAISTNRHATTFKNEFGYSAVENMIAGRMNGIAGDVVHRVGNIYSTGGTTWECKTVSTPINISNFTALDVVSVRDFGAKGDGITDDSLQIEAAIATGNVVRFPKAIYNLGTYEQPYTLSLNHDNQTLSLAGSELRFVGKGHINIRANNVTIDAQGGTLNQHIGYAEVASDTTSGATTIEVVDSSTLFVGQDVASSWGNTGGSGVYPLGGPTDSPKRKIQSIVGNVVTLDRAMDVGDILAKQVIFGDFTFGVFIQSYKDNFTLRNATLDRITGYYYHTPNAVGDPALVIGGRVYFENCYFAGNGTDQFLIKHGQKLHFTNCRSEQMWDTAKTGVYFADDGSLYVSNSDMCLGNYDASITMTNIWDSSISKGEIILSDSNFYGGTRFTSPPIGSQGADNLHFIEVTFQGSFDRISMSNCRFAGYTRQCISSTVIQKTVNTVINSIRIDNCLIDGGFAFFYHSGVGNGITCPNVSISNTSFYQDDEYIFFDVQQVSGAVSTFVPKFNNCYFRFSASASGYAEFGSQAYVSDSTFNMNSIPYTHSRGIVELDNCLFTGNPTFAIRPSYDVFFFGELGRIVIDSADFPTNVNNVFTALGGISLNGAKLASARSPNGSVFYDVYKVGSLIYVSGEFTKANGVYQLRADDYFIPKGSTIKDMFTGTVERVTFNLPTSLTSAASAGASSINVTTSTGVVAGDMVNVLLDNVIVATLVVGGSYSGGNTIPLTDTIPSEAATGNKVNFFRVAPL